MQAIEAALRGLPNVRACVVLTEGEGRSRYLVAYVVPDQCSPATDDDSGHLAADLRSALKRQLPYYMIPAHFVLLPRLVHVWVKVNHNG